MTNTLVLRTACHPEANGRQVQHGEQFWEITIPLEDETVLYLHMGRTTHDAFRACVLREELDDAADDAQEALGEA